MDAFEFQNVIAKELDIADLSAQKQAEIIEQATQSVLLRIVAETMDRLSSDDRVMFEEVRKTDDPEEVIGFLRSRIENFDAVLSQTVASYKQELRRTIEQLNSL